jgi:catechol 2,3-dioxygenase-like lactoylglutathione lyase family enzyme
MLRKRATALFVALVLPLLALGSEAPIARVDAVGMTVSDMDRSVEFYANVLTFEKVSDVEVWGEDFEALQGVFGSRMRIVRMRLGSEEIELTEYLAPRGRPIPADSRSNDRWFQHVAIIVSDMDQAYRTLRQHKVQHASSGPQRLPDWNPNAGGIEAFYFKDPDGRPLEILEFPEGKGDPRWHELGTSGRLFLGIDHTAIVVLDTDVSLEFYRDRLGFRVAGASENYGIEQERLNNVFGARLRITALRAKGGPGIELLEYLTPRDGRPMPLDERANDLIHWQTLLVSPDAASLASNLLSGRGVFVSPGLVEIDGFDYPFPAGFLVRDPDGHVMQVLQEEIHGAVTRK